MEKLCCGPRESQFSVVTQRHIDKDLVYIAIDSVRDDKAERFEVKNIMSQVVLHSAIIPSHFIAQKMDVVALPIPLLKITILILDHRVPSQPFHQFISFLRVTKYRRYLPSISESLISRSMSINGPWLSVVWRHVKVLRRYELSLPSSPR